MLKRQEKKNNKVIVVLPAYNAGRTLEKIYGEIPKNTVSNIILVDDGSKDRTVEIAKRLGIKTITHKKNLGYGANQKTCYNYALKQGAHYIIMVHPDGQYDPHDLPKFIRKLETGKYGLVLGSRFLSGGDKTTPAYKSFSIRVITFLFNLVLGINITEANTGYRGYTKECLKRIPYHKNGAGYLFDPQAIIQTKYFGFKIGEVAVIKDYNEGASSPNFRKSLEHGLENIHLLIQYSLHKFGIKKADFLMP